VVRPFLFEITMRDSAQLVVNARKHGAQGLVVAGLPIRQ